MGTFKKCAFVLLFPQLTIAAFFTIVHFALGPSKDLNELWAVFSGVVLALTTVAVTIIVAEEWW
jgi:hypothetical protein